MPEICLLGTGGMLPLKNRFLTSLYAEYNGKSVLIDCGECTQVALSQHGLKISRIEIILITHSHADHITGLPGLLLSIGNCSRTEPIDIYIPASAENMVKNLISVCGTLPYEVNIHILPDRNPTAFLAEKIDSMLMISTIPLEHSVNCIGYRLTLSRKPVFAPEKAKSLDIPVKYWKILHGGTSVTLDDGRTFSPADVTRESRPPITVTYTTDTLPIPSITDFAQNSDLFICEGMYGDTEKKQSMNEKGHMLMQDACEIALKANVKKLWLTHYSPAETEPVVYEQELKEIFPSVTVSHDGEKITL
ncbi:MAG: ribonuclease Z [Muribaculaceae bacterium]|nr:ribonuclease Z [Alistipes senegalensis]MCM1474089.1 ribonuclease Z [Muribaculaceae bacterium]